MADVTGARYREHHAIGDRYSFTLGGDERGGWFKREIDGVARARGGTLDVLDVGCRDGTLTRYYAGGHRVKGLDVDEVAVASANRVAGVEAQKIDLNIDPIPFPDSSFDVVVAGEVLEHLQWPDVVVKEIHRSLRPGGAFIGSVPNAFRLRNRLDFLLGREFEHDPTHLRQFSPARLRKLLADFRETRIEFHGGRRRDTHPRLFATNMHWVARR